MLEQDMILPADPQVSCDLHPSPNHPDLADTGNSSVPGSASWNILHPCPRTYGTEQQLRMWLKMKKNCNNFQLISTTFPTYQLLHFCCEEVL